MVTAERDLLTLAPAGISFGDWASAVRELAAEREAVILAHSYQVPWIQEVADFVGDSLELSRQAATTEAKVIVFCGVLFMAETAKVLSPEKVVLIPDPQAGCSLAATITASQLRAWKAEHPGAVVVAYVNTSAEVKAEADYCCTSANAARVVAQVPPGREILFLPDMFLGAQVQRVTGREMRLWMGECHVHAGIEPADISARLDEHPDAELHIHPECGCASHALYLASTGDLPPGRTHILGTAGMLRRAHRSDAAQIIVATETGLLHRLRQENPDKEFIAANQGAVCHYMKAITPHILGTAGMLRRAHRSDAAQIIVATETGLLHRLRRENPDKEFIAANQGAVCHYMKAITPHKLLRSLREMVHEVTVPEDIAAAARLAIERMIEIG